MTQIYDILVLGCGAAGVAALSHLAEEGEGLNVLGLEGNNVLGGRILSRHFAEGVVDLGAQYCTEATDNVVYNMVKDFDVLDHPTEEKKHIFTNGHVLDEIVTDKYRKLLLSIMHDARKTAVRKTEPLIDYMRVKYEKQLETVDFAVNQELAKEMFDWFIKSTWAKLSTNELMEKSVNSLRESWDNVGEKWLNWKGNGYNLLMDVLLKKYPDSTKALPVNILYSKEVVNIRWGQKNSSTSRGETVVHVTCRDGTNYIARHVIITFSIGVLQERLETLFTPSLPDYKLLCIKSLAMCTMNKIFMRFPTQWWPNSYTHFGFLWKEADKNIYIDENSWMTEVYALTTVEMQPNVLCAYVAGAAAEEMELHATSEVSERMQQLLQHFFGETYTIPQPTEVIRSTWYTDSLIRGAYSYRSIETEYMECGATVLGEPLLTDNIPTICFAGEATSIHHHSTVHGAVESGYREAKRLIALLKA